ncbi:hypothetical protein BS78_08G099500 [Paspalum vaginatum]|nr:hypothetical protein BS78_08G099500 [Paspalum vaginatum]
MQGHAMAVTRLLPLTVLCLFLLLAASAVVPAATAAAAGGDYYGGGARMVVITRGTGTRVIGAARGDRSHNKWQHHRRLVEELVAPELGGGMLGASGSGIGYDALDKNSPECQRDNQCAAKSGGSYTRPCTYKDHCRH